MDFFQPARTLGAEILAGAGTLEDGSLFWGRGSDRDRGFALDSGPFNGRCGEGLLFAALHAASGDASFQKASLRAFLGLRQGLPDERYRSDLAGTLAHGLSGLGGILYALVRAAGFLRSPELMESAEQLASVLTPELIAADRRFDVIWGSAGALLGLLALADTGSTDALRRAEQCAAHLLACRTADPESGLRAWITLASVPSSGFAHGACGIAQALLQLHRRTGDPESYEAAMEAFAFERTLYRQDLLNWQDSREEPDPRMWSWCHGAAGIGLSRLAVLGCLRDGDETAMARDLQGALRGSLAARLPGVDTACCGYFGRIDFLLEAGLRLGNPALQEHARRIARERLEHAREAGEFQLTNEEDTPEHLKPGFWQGLGGLTYTLLRLSDPGKYPCVLAMA